jgi:hypothetical protein
MAANFIKWIIPAFNTSDGHYDIIICRGSMDLDQAAADTITLTTTRHFTGEIDISKDRDVNNRLVVADIAALNFIDGASYKGTSDGSPINVDLTSEGLTLFKHIVNDRSMLYTLWVRRKKGDSSYEYPFSGDFKRKDVKFDDDSIYGHGTTSEHTTGLVQIKCSPLTRRLEDLTIEDLVRTFTILDTPERGGGSSDHVQQPHYAGFRKAPGAIFTTFSNDVSYYGTDKAKGSLTLAFQDTAHGADNFRQFDYSINLLAHAGLNTPFPASFWGMSIYKILARLFSNPAVDTQFTTSSYDSPNYTLGKQTWNATPPVKFQSNFSLAQTPGDLYVNFNVTFGIDPRPLGRNVFSVNAGTDVFTTLVDHNYQNGDILWLMTTGTLPGGISALTDYYVINKTDDTFQVSLTEGGAAVDVTSTGSGTHTAYRQLWMDSPNTLKRGAKSLELVKWVCVQFGWFMEFGVIQSGADEGRATIYFRQRLQSPPSAWPSNLILTKSGEEPPRKPLIIKASYVGDEDELYIPRLPQEGDEVLEVKVPWRNRPLATTDGHVFSQHFRLNEKLSYDEQGRCIYERNSTSDDYVVHDYSHVTGAFLFYFKVKDSTNDIYPSVYDNFAQHYGDTNNWEGLHALNLARWASDTTSETENLLAMIARINANDLLRGEYGLRRIYKGVVDGSDSTLGLKPLCSYSTRREGATRNYYSDKVRLRLRAQVTEVVFEEQPGSYATLDDYPIFKKQGGQLTSGGGRSDGSNTTDNEYSEVYLANNQSSDTRNTSQSKTGDYYNLRFRPYDGSATKDMARFESYDGATLFSKFDVTGQLLTYRQGAVQINPYGTSAGNTGEVRWYELVANGAHYAGFKAPDSLAASNIYTLPTAFPASNYILQSSTAGVLTWVDPASLFSTTGLVTKSPGTVDRNMIIATADGVEALAIKRYSGSTAGIYTFSVYDASGNFKFGVDDNMNVRLDSSSLIFGTNSPISLGGSHGTSGVSVITSAGSGSTPTWTSITSLITDAVIINPGASTRNVVQPTGNFIAQVWKNNGSQAVNLNEWHTSGGSVMSSVSKDGYFRINNNGTLVGALQMTQPASTHGIVMFAQSGASNSHAAFILRDNGDANNVFRLGDTGKVAIGVGASDQGFLTVLQATLGSPVLALMSVATNDDPKFQVTQGRATTTDGATWTTVATITMSTSTTQGFFVILQGVRTGGAGGAAQDGWDYGFRGYFKNAAGTVTQIGATTALWQHESNVNGNFRFNINGTAVEIQALGVTNNNITWHAPFVGHAPVGS